MSTYRSRLEAGAHPATDARRASELRAELRRLAAAMTPAWRPTEERDDFGSALLRIGARLAEQVTSRLDGTAERDALAFFDFLGLPPDPPRAAEGALVLALDEQQSSPVWAPARTQVSAAAADGEQAVFETQAALRVSPGRIAELVVVDPSRDHIELAPARVTDVVAPPTLPADYRLVTFAGAGSSTIQLSPGTGLAAADALRVGGRAHRVGSVGEQGIVTLLDPLEAPAPAGTVASRITTFETFTLRNAQRHRFFVGHADLLNLEQRATILLDLTPARLAQELRGMDIEYSMFGTASGEDEPGWHHLELLGTSGSAIRLAKTWDGAVEETEVSGRSSRWIRAELRGPIVDRQSPTSRASALRLSVSSVMPPADPQAEGSRTVAHAALNGNPLATAGRFYPFGPEPVRFDTFALAAPEALSKQGATAALTISLADASMVAFSVVVTDAPRPWSGYGVGRNGNLQVVLDADGRFRWFEVELHTRDGAPMLLDDVAPVAVASSRSEADILIAQDRSGRVWSAAVRRHGTPTVTVDGDWHPVDPLAAASAASTGMPAALPAPAGRTDAAAVLLDVLDGRLFSLWLDARGIAIGTWSPVDAPAGGPVPVLPDSSRLTAVQGAAWPLRPDRLEVIGRDALDQLWVGRMSDDGVDAGLGVAWTKLVVPPMSDDAALAASRFRDGAGEERWWICYRGKAAGRLVGVVLRDEPDRGVSVVKERSQDDAPLAVGSALHINPTVRGPAGLPATVGLASPADAVVVWLADGSPTTTPLPTQASALRPQLLATHSAQDLGGWEVLVPGAGERLSRVVRPETPEVDCTLHSIVEFEPEGDSDWAPSHLEIAEDLGAAGDRTMIALTDDARVFYDPATKARSFSVDAPELTVGKQLRFLRLRSYGKRYTGSFDNPRARQELSFGGSGAALSAGSVIVIDSASYIVQAVAVGTAGSAVATLDRAVPGGVAAEFEIANRHRSGGVVLADQVATLARLQTSATPTQLAFGGSSSPHVQQVRRAKRMKDVLWARLGAAWATPPPPTTTVKVPVDPVVRASVRVRDYRSPELSWEYFDGDGWQRLVLGFLDGTHDLSTSGTIRFVVPADLTTTEIGGKESYWIRARLIGGDYGRPAYLVQGDADPQVAGSAQSIVVDTTDLHPPEIVSIEATFDAADSAPEHILAENNVDVLDHTQAGIVPSATFELFQAASAIDPAWSGRALFAGCTGQLRAGPITLLVDAVDQGGAGTARVDVLTPDGWRRVPADDRTATLRRTGMLALALQHDQVALRLFGQDRTWLRLRPASDPDAPWAPHIRLLLPNAVAVRHARTIADEVLGSSVGAPGMTVHLSSPPVLPESVELRVREDLSVEERLALEEAHRAEPGGSEPTWPVVVDDLARAPGTWVRWARVDSLTGQPRDARVFVLDPGTGRATFGDDRSGRIPPAGRDGIRAFSYQQGGGALGNVGAWSPTRMSTAIAGVDVAALPLGASGGAESPPSSSVFATAPHRLRHAGRALAPADVEALAVASSSDILRARCRRPERPGEPIRVAVVVRSETARCPMPTHAQRESVEAALRASAWGGLVSTGIAVDGPSYVRVVVRVALVSPSARWAEVERDAWARLVRLFDPTVGGPLGAGWPFGRTPGRADVLRVLGHVPGIDRVASIDITGADGRPPAPLPIDGVACAEAGDVIVTVSEGGIEP